MNNLFSTFDPSTQILSMNWMSIILPIIMIPSSYWIIQSRINKLWNLIILNLHKEFKLLMGKSNTGMTLMMISLFTTILATNFMGLFPYIFTTSSHLCFTLTLALPLWISFMIYGWFNKTIHMLSHLVPQGTPAALMSFMVCIETVSNCIRPGTLAIRLTANMIAGHLLLTLLGNTGPLMNTSMVSILIITQIMLLILESAVAIIQSYVFAVLSTLYFSEI
uniref:ATP synthase subunit a n=1 Tax=Gibbium aequinoctiale TaxID=1050274 RepID=A0A8K1Y1S2_9COLE|nr:ATP synthase F0 subunit 6 [Gibbium aequinoctiale]ATN40781.1 ATP synthase F0 subunit 6 [Gibbium aequinoctiale]